MPSTPLNSMGRLLLLLPLLTGPVPLCGGEKDSFPPSQPEWQWYRGNLHTHTLWSDGDDFPEMVALWYRDQGYHFLAISDTMSSPSHRSGSHLRN